MLSLAAAKGVRYGILWGTSFTTISICTLLTTCIGAGAKSSTTGIFNATAISARVSMVKLCVPLNHLVISEGFLFTLSAYSLLPHPLSVMRSSKLAARVILVWVCPFCTGVISPNILCIRGLLYFLGFLSLFIV